jgi:hypothetical protein
MTVTDYRQALKGYKNIMENTLKKRRNGKQYNKN